MQNLEEEILLTDDFIKGLEFVAIKELKTIIIDQRRTSKDYKKYIIFKNKTHFIFNEISGGNEETHLYYGFLSKTDEPLKNGEILYKSIEHVSKNPTFPINPDFLNIKSQIKKIDILSFLTIPKDLSEDFKNKKTFIKFLYYLKDPKRLNDNKNFLHGLYDEAYSKKLITSKKVDYIQYNRRYKNPKNFKFQIIKNCISTQNTEDYSFIKFDIPEENRKNFENLNTFKDVFIDQCLPQNKLFKIEGYFFRNYEYPSYHNLIKRRRNQKDLITLL